MMRRLVLLHGWGQDKRTWQGLLETFGNEAVAWDLPGFGAEKVEEEWGVPEYAEWVERKIKKEGWSRQTRLVLMGHSFGGRIAAEIASKQPEWLAGLILYGAPCLYRPSWKIVMIKHLAKRWRWFKLIKRLVVSSELADADKKGLGKVFRRVVVYDQTEQLSTIKVPTLVLWGEKDGAVPVAMAKEMNSLIDKSKLEIVEDGGHNVHLSNPMLFNGIVKRWYESI